MDANSRDKGVYAFGPFRLDPVRRLLFRNAVPVKLSARLFDTLLYLVENHDRLVEHFELEQAVWRGRTVEEGNVAKAVYSLRKALQTEDLAGQVIVTVAGRGYRFAAPVVFEAAPSGVTAAEPEVGEPTRVGATDASSMAAPWWRSRTYVYAGALAMMLAAWAAVWGIRPAQETARPAAPLHTADAPFAPPPHSVAVMAFTNLSGDPGQEYFSDGISEELIDALGRIGAIRVAARLSSFSFKGKSATVGEIARTLNVGTVLEGSVRRDGPRVRVTAQLIDAVSGFQMWSHSYDRAGGEIFRLQGEIAEAVAGSLKVTLLGTDTARLIVGGTDNAAAFDADLRGYGLLLSNGMSDKAVPSALADFDRAISLDPKFAIAHLHRGEALGLLRVTSAINDLVEVRKLTHDAIAECEIAVSLAPDLAAAHAELSDNLLDSLDFRRSEAEISRAMELAPGDSAVLGRYGRMEVMLGHTDRGLAAIEKAVALNPSSPRAYGGLAWMLLTARRYDDALAALRRRQMLGGVSTGYWSAVTGYAQYFKGDAEAARRTCSDESNWQENECLAFAYHALGRQPEAEAQLAKLRAKMGDTRALDYADIYAQWGDTAKALDWLETAYRLRENTLYMIKTDPDLDPIRNTARYKEIERKLDFP